MRIDMRKGMQDLSLFEIQHLPGQAFRTAYQV